MSRTSMNTSTRLPSTVTADLYQVQQTAKYKSTSFKSKSSPLKPVVKVRGTRGLTPLLPFEPPPPAMV